MTKIYYSEFVLCIGALRSIKRTNRKDEDTKMSDRITIEEWILLLLYARKDKPIDGKLMFVKELFLLEKEVFPKIKGIKDSFSFYAYDLGPYSTKFAKKLNKLIQNEFVEAIPIPDTDNYRFKLTIPGIEKAEDILRKISTEDLKLIAKKRRGWDQLGYFGITRRIYSKYPEYTIRSKILTEIMGEESTYEY